MAVPGAGRSVLAVGLHLSAYVAKWCDLPQLVVILSDLSPQG
jgi:hypothetical protein